MKEENVRHALSEARRFIKAIEDRDAHVDAIVADRKAHVIWIEAKDLDENTPDVHAYWERCPRDIASFNAAIRRASLDLSRALVTLRHGR